MVTAPEGGLNRLMGLSYAVARRAKRGQPIDGQFERAEKYTADFQAFALQLQNADGSWGPHFLAARSTSPDAAAQLRSTGRVLEWLAISLPDKQLEDARVMKAVEYVAGLLGSQRTRATRRRFPRGRLPRWDTPCTPWTCTTSGCSSRPTLPRPRSRPPTSSPPPPAGTATRPSRQSGRPFIALERQTLVCRGKMLPQTPHEDKSDDSAVR